jgi:hypothetical protein
VVRKFCLGLAVVFGLLRTSVDSTVSVSLTVSFAGVMSVFKECFVDITELISEFFISFCRFHSS